MTRCDAYIALGSNLCNPPQQIVAAIEALKNIPETNLVAYATPQWYAPVGGPVQQDDFLNSVAHLRTALPPDTLLSILLDIETRQGRIRRYEERNGPRTIDLDLLFYGNLISDTASMIVPHPRLALRAFVLEPLNSIAPDWMHPVAGLTVAELLRKLKNADPWIDPQEDPPVCKHSTT